MVARGRGSRYRRMMQDWEPYEKDKNKKVSRRTVGAREINLELATGSRLPFCDSKVSRSGLAAAMMIWMAEATSAPAAPECWGIRRQGYHRSVTH